MMTEMKIRMMTGTRIEKRKMTAATQMTKTRMTGMKMIKSDHPNLFNARHNFFP